jgi:hypothetical protein
VHTGLSVDIFPGSTPCTEHCFVSICAFPRHSASQAVCTVLSLDQQLNHYTLTLTMMQGSIVTRKQNTTSVTCKAVDQNSSVRHNTVGCVMSGVRRLNRRYYLNEICSSDGH